MADELTVLLVGADAPPEDLSELLEKQQVFAEHCSPGELKNMLQLAEPALVVQFGPEGARSTVDLLKETRNERTVHVVIVADRDHLPEMRKLDRTVVGSLLATDMPSSVIASRIVMTARKGPARSNALPRPRAPRPMAPTTTSTLAKLKSSSSEDSVLTHLPPSPKPSWEPPAQSSKKTRAGLLSSLENGQTSPEFTPSLPRKPKAPPAPKAPPPLPAPKATGDTPSPTFEPHSSKPGAPPRDTPSSTTEAPPSAAESSNAESSNAESSERKAGDPLPPNLELESSSKIKAASSSRLKISEPEVPDAPRIAVADTDCTRGDLIACALREAGIPARLVPLDPAATRWHLVRAFRPTLLVADASAIQSEGRVWHQLFAADESLKTVKLAAVSFGQLFGEEDGLVDLRILGTVVPSLSDCIPTRPATDPGGKRNALPDSEFDIPTTSHTIDEPPAECLRSDPHNEKPAPEEEDDRETTFFEGNSHVSSEAPINETKPSGSRAAPPRPKPSQVTTARETPWAKGERRSPSSFSSTTALGEDTAAAAPVVQASSASSGGSPTRFIAAAAVLAAIAGGAWFAQSRGLFERTGNDQTRSAKGSTATEPPQPIPSAKKSGSGKASGPDAAGTAPEPEEATEEPEELNLFRVQVDESVPDCETLVDNLEELEVGGIGQASLSWNRARQKLVQGDLDAALRLMCEAALLHPRSMAIEGLASLYLTKHAPHKAMVWVKKGLEVRPNRRKTRELEGDVYVQLGELEKAREIWSGTLNVDPEDQKTLDAVANQFAESADQRLRSGDIAGAETFFRRAAALSSTNAHAAAGVAEVLLERGDLAGARAWAERSLEVKDNYGTALVVLADLALKNENEEEALALYKKAVQSAPNARAHSQIYRLEH